jgi:PAS domain S-box-containing protein
MEETAPAKPILINILVVDDRPENRRALKAILSAPDYHLVEASSGPEALLRLLEDEFAVLLIDVVMPQMNGFELAEAIKQRERTAAVPIVFLSAEAADVDLIYKGYRAGAVDYLVKPLVPEMVRAKVAVFAELFRQRKRIEEQARLLIDGERAKTRLQLVELQLAGERRYRQLADAVPDIIWTAGADGVVDYLNRQWSEYTGLTLEQTGGTWAGTLHPHDVHRCDEAWREAIGSGHGCQMEVRLRGADGLYRWHLGRAVPERSASGEIVSWLGTFTNIEDQKRAQAEREYLYQEAVGAIRARDDFVSVASHELRTPLTALQMQVEMLLPIAGSRRLALTPEQVKAKAEMAARQIQRLNRLIGELMDVSRLTAGRLKLEREPLDLSALVRDVAVRLADEAAKAHTAISVRGPSPVIGEWDRLRLEQVVTNLMTNALKFGAGSPVEVTVSEQGSAARIVVSDQGIGIAPQDVERIFDRYEQAISTRTYGGLGLGLYIVRQLVEAHGGSVSVESHPGTGSAFMVELPTATATSTSSSTSVDDARA